ncbi:hypothetical protein [Actinoplanes sp. TFC3]|uniref:hypothetical protein n=1 Tax=Actinoplanes sp. TFC3 TaxID=1710355 RepID=UPI00082E7287|nr:hypothetical protein [Actinoplanes sp. TFC3]
MFADDPLSQLYPLHGPYDPVRTTGAAHLVDDLIRYLTYATKHETAVPGVNEAYEMAGSLKLASGKLPQMLHQLSVRAVADPARPESQQVADALQRAGEAAGALTGALAAVQSTLRNLALAPAPPGATILGFPEPGGQLAA